MLLALQLVPATREALESGYNSLILLQGDRFTRFTVPITIPFETLNKAFEGTIFSEIFKRISFHDTSEKKKGEEVN